MPVHSAEQSGRKEARVRYLRLFGSAVIVVLAVIFFCWVFGYFHGV